MRTTAITTSACNHTAIQHAFYHALCSNQTSLKRVTNVALAGLLLIGALFVVRLLFRAQKSASTQLEYSLPCWSSIELALNKIPATRPVLPFSACNSETVCHQPVNPQITRLYNLYSETTYQDFLRAFQTNNDDPGGSEATVTAVRSVVEITYAISCLTLDDLTPSIQKIFRETKIQRTPAQALVATDSYQRQTFHLFGALYHIIRSKNWNTESFYEANTITGHWRMLYNDYCERVRTHISEEDLRRINPLYAEWTQADTDQNTFTSHPSKI